MALREDVEIICRLLPSVTSQIEYMKACFESDKNEFVTLPKKLSELQNQKAELEKELQTMFGKKDRELRDKEIALDKRQSELDNIGYKFKQEFAILENTRKNLDIKAKDLANQIAALPLKDLLELEQKTREISKAEADKAEASKKDVKPAAIKTDKKG